MPTGTTNYGWSKPDVGGSSGAWGTLLNAIFDAIDAVLFATTAVANAALPKAGGTMTGHTKFLTTAEEKYGLGNVAGTTANIDLTNANHFFGTVTGDWVPQFQNAHTGSSGFILELTNGGAHTITWPGVLWPGGSPPSLTAAGVDLLTFITRDDGASWRGVLAAKDSR